MPTQEERYWATAAHAGQIAALFVSAGLLAWLPPLVIWLGKRNESRFVADHAREAVNFQITMWLILVVYAVASSLLVCVGVGVLMLLAIPALYFLPVLILGLDATMAANRGETYRYPYILRLLS